MGGGVFLGQGKQPCTQTRNVVLLYIEPLELGT